MEKTWLKHYPKGVPATIDVDQYPSLVALLEDWSGTFPGWHIYYPKQRHTPATVRAFVDFIARQR